MNPELVDGFSILGLLGDGGSAAVYEARQETPPRRVALKILRGEASDPVTLSRFSNEVEMLGRSVAGGIPRLLRAGITRDGRPWLAMDLIEGTSLLEAARGRGCGLRERVELARLSADVIGQLHRRGIAHGDLEPRHIVVGAKRRPHVLDLGAARNAAESGGDVQADVLALGHVLRVLVEDRPARERVPRSLQAVLDKAVAPRRADRYVNAAALAEDLALWLNGQPTSARPPGPMDRARTWTRRYRILFLCSAVILISLGAATAVALGAAQRLREAAASKRRWATDASGLAGLWQLADLRRRADELWPAEPWRTPDMRAWLADAERVVAHVRTSLEQHAPRASETPRAQSRGPGAAGATAEAVEDRWKEALFARLAQELEDFERPLDGLRANVAGRIAAAVALSERPGGADVEAWAAATLRIADPNASARYGGFSLGPQPGLLPLGPDSDGCQDGGRGLELFLALGTGAVPARNPETGQLLARPEDGIVLVLVPGRPATPHDAGDGRPQAAEPPAIAPFFIGKYELTQAQYARLGGGVSYYFVGWKGRSPEAVSPLDPAENMTVDEAERALLRCGLRLPSTDEWRLAARGGTTTRWWTGDDEASFAGAANLDVAGTEQTCPGWSRSAHDPYDVHAAVGRFRPNPFGLYDVIGNVEELTRCGAGPTDILSAGGAFTDAALCAWSDKVRPSRADERWSQRGVRVARSVRGSPACGQE